MKTALTLACILFAVLHKQHVAAQSCYNVQHYSKEFVPTCAAGETTFLWPNYNDATTYYKCYGVGNPTLVSCPQGQVYAHVFQMCTTCSNYIPPVPCEQLKTDTTPNCQPIGSVTPSPGGNTPSVPSGPTMPTPNYPDGETTAATTAAPTTAAPTTAAPTTAGPTTAGPTTAAPTTAAPTTAGPAVPTPPSDGSTEFPGPPSPVTNAPDVPTPETAPPTPPSIPAEPPNVEVVP